MQVHFHVLLAIACFLQNVRWLLDDKYTTGPEGIPGNDDYGLYGLHVILLSMVWLQCGVGDDLSVGTMSAWYVWGALGLYPLTGTDKYFIGSPAVERATINLHDGIVMYCTIESGLYHMLSVTLLGLLGT